MTLHVLDTLTPPDGAIPVRSFLSAPPALSSLVHFGFIFPDYARSLDRLGTPGRETAGGKRMPTGRATLFFAFDVKVAGGRTVSGLFCEGPQAESSESAHEFGEAVGVKLRVGALGALLRVPAKELRNARVPLDAIWGSDAVELADRMATAASAIDRLRILEHALVRRIPNHAEGNRVVAHIAELIEQTEGLVRIRDLSRECGLSDRALLYRFDECAGLTPKQYARVVRLRACIARLDAWSCVDWAALATEHSFYDQAHLTREFRRLLGTSPSTFLRQRQAYSSVAAPAVGRGSVPHRDQRLYRTLGFVSYWDR